MATPYRAIQQSAQSADRELRVLRAALDERRHIAREDKKPETAADKN